MNALLESNRTASVPHPGTAMARAENPCVTPLADPPLASGSGGAEPATAARPIALPVTQAGLTLARLIGFADGRPLVMLPGKPEPTTASAACLLSANDAGRLVAVMFIDADTSLPLIIGAIAAEAASSVQSEPPARLEIQAKNEIVLKCGRATLRLLADGTAVLRGVNVITRAAATNRIRGGNVQIN